MTTTSWKPGVPQTIDGVEYVVVQFSVAASKSDADIAAMERAGFAHLCSGCPLQTACPPYYCDGFPALDPLGDRRIVPMSIVPILALEGVLE